MGPRPQQVLAERGDWGNLNPSHLIPPLLFFRLSASIRLLIHRKWLSRRSTPEISFRELATGQASVGAGWGHLEKGPRRGSTWWGCRAGCWGAWGGLDETPRGSPCWLGLPGTAPAIRPFSPGHLMGAVMGGMEGQMVLGQRCFISKGALLLKADLWHRSRVSGGTCHLTLSVLWHSWGSSVEGAWAALPGLGRLSLVARLPSALQVLAGRGQRVPHAQQPCLPHTWHQHSAAQLCGVHSPVPSNSQGWAQMLCKITCFMPMGLQGWGWFRSSHPSCGTTSIPVSLTGLHHASWARTTRREHRPSGQW